MEIRSLADTGIDRIVASFNRAFAGYFVPMPTEVSYWANRFAATGVDYAFSYGAFDGEELAAFVLQAVGTRDGQRVAFNTGTGVLPGYRGQGWVDRLYDYAWPRLRASGVARCQLEVIDINARAIRVYERIGFTRDRYLRSFAGRLALPPQPDFTETPATLEELSAFPYPTGPYAWDFTTETLARTATSYRIRKVFAGANTADWIGYYLLNPENGYIAQLEARSGFAATVLAGVQRHCASVKIHNVAAERTGLIEQLTRSGLDNTVNQYEMSLAL
jgi:ribosomal protein S18 acetylase RimI-like enzyme